MCVLNLHWLPVKFDKYIDILRSAAEDICFEIIKEAAEKVVILKEGNRDFSVTIDSMW